MDDFPTVEEQLSGFPVAEYRATLEQLWQKQQQKQQLAKEDERVLLALYARLPELQQQLTPPYGTRLGGGKTDENQDRTPEGGRLILGRNYEITVPVT